MIKFFLFFLFSANLFAKDRSTEPALFEAGIFGGTALIPDYPASDQSRNRSVVLPIIYYSGDIFRSDEDDGTRFRFINSANFDLDLSFGGSFSTESENNYARQGMPALDWTLEIGPRLLYYFFKDKNIGQVRVGLPFRTVVGTNFTKWYSVGNLVSPTLQIDKYNFLANDLDFYFIYNFTYADEGEADYFYQIEPIYSNAERLAFDAKSGFWGYDVSLALKYNFNKFKLIWGSRYSDYSGSANSQSYLHRSNINWSHFFGVTWLLYESEIKGVH